MFKKIYDGFEESISIFFFLLIFVLMSVQIFTRYLMNFTLPWSIELSRYTFVWLTFIGAAFVRKQNTHIKIEIVYNLMKDKLPLGAQKALWLIKQMLTFGFLLLLIYFGYILASKSWRFKSQAMQIPQFFLYISVSVGAGLYLIREIIGSLDEYRKTFLENVTRNT